MIFHHLNGSHIVMTDTVGGYAVFSAEQIGAFDIEFVDILSLIFYLAVSATSMPGIRFKTSPILRSSA